MGMLIGKNLGFGNRSWRYMCNPTTNSKMAGTGPITRAQMMTHVDPSENMIKYLETEYAGRQG